MPLRIFKQLLALCMTAMASLAFAGEGIVVREGDIIVADQFTARSIAVGSTLQLWPDGIIPYTLDPALPADSILSITRAIRHWNEVGGISLLPLADVHASTGTDVADSVRFTTGDYCASWVGRRGGQQNLWVAPNCPAGSIMHEIGHLLGLEHEHTRPDRDQYIQIHWENISADKQHNFDAAPASSRLPGAYDYDSIMHYGTHNFSSNGQPTITALDGVSHNLGQRVAPSTGDLQAIADLYGTDLSVLTNVVAGEPTAEVDIYVSNLTGQGAHDIRLVIGSSDDTLEPPEGQGNWRCESYAAETVTCELSRLPASTVEQITLSLPDEKTMDELEIDVEVTSRTPDDDLSNNASTLPSDEASGTPHRSPLDQLAATLGQKTEVQEDAVAQAAVGGGSFSLISLAGLLFLVVGQACRRIYL